jgi:hypothetical protein
VRRQADVAALEAHGEEAANGERAAEPVGPVVQLPAKPHDEDHGRVVLYAERFIDELDVTDQCRAGRDPRIRNHL